jgi:hypothetical protein
MLVWPDISQFVDFSFYGNPLHRSVNELTCCLKIFIAFKNQCGFSARAACAGAKPVGKIS